jgi:hypothetical protein
MKELDKPMYFGAKPSIFQAAHILRKIMTVQEIMLWEKLKVKQNKWFPFQATASD